MGITRRRILKTTGGGLAAVLASGVAPYGFVRNIVKAADSDTIKVGILHSLSGTIAIIESSLHNAELLAIEEINAKGGVLGKKLQPVVEDPQSLVQVFAEKAKKLLLEDKVVAVLGCYTSASRQSVLPVFEENNGVLLYPTLYEAQECSKNCFYTGAVPNQQLDDFVPWILNTLGRKKFYLIGANYIYPKETNREVKALLQKHGGTTVAEEYSPLGSTEFSTNINKIASSGADIVFSDLSRRPDRRVLQAVQGVRHYRQGHSHLHADYDGTRNRGDGRGECARALYFVQLLPERRYPTKQIVCGTLQGQVRQGCGDQRRDGGCLFPDLLPRPGDRQG